MFDQVRVYFSDDTSTVMYVHEDDDIPSAIVELCEEEGWDISDVINYSIEDTIQEEA